MDVSTLEGRELDALVAEKVMGDNTDRFIWKRPGKPDCYQSSEYGGPQHYSSDIAMAWVVVEKIQELYPERAWNIFQVNTKGGIFWEISFWGLDVEEDVAPVYAVDISIAICRVALMVVIGDKDNDDSGSEALP